MPIFAHYEGLCAVFEPACEFHHHPEELVVTFPVGVVEGGQSLIAVGRNERDQAYLAQRGKLSICELEVVLVVGHHDVNQTALNAPR